MKKALIVTVCVVVIAVSSVLFSRNVTDSSQATSSDTRQSDVTAVVPQEQGTSTVGKWRRWVLQIPNNTYSGNPFELEIDATFRHSASGTTITLPGYYNGSNIWEVGFMPTQVGEWTYTTSSQDADLDGVAGSITAVESGLPGMLEADPRYPRKWKFTDGGYVVPIQFRMEFFFEEGSIETFEAVADFLKNDVGGHIFDTRLTDENRWYDNRSDYIFEGDWRNHQFDLANWNRFEERMEVLASRGLGAHIMFYSDDSGQPGWSGKSATEQLVIRYVIARTAGYPIVWYNTGIDIAEYRDQSWVNWFGEQIRSLDPYGHPVSSRYGGGSGSHVMSGQTWDSRGDRHAKINRMIGYFDETDVPVSMDDAWHENSPEGERRNKNFSEHDIRRAFWKCTVAGGLGGIIRGFDGFFHIADFQNDLESEQFLRLINTFIGSKLGDTFGAMVPDQSLVDGDGAYALADPDRAKILYFSVGKNDQYDSGSGGPFTATLSDTSKQRYAATWFDPRTGNETAAGSFEGGSDHVFTPPSADDWILLMVADGDSTTPPICGESAERLSTRDSASTADCDYLPVVNR